ncbi:MAG TPA: hypothetical protein VHB21_08850 [Minicystis sp.]|nr:hypothetical protein [Minicystis sp.]
MKHDLVKHDLAGRQEPERPSPWHGRSPRDGRWLPGNRWAEYAGFRNGERVRRARASMAHRALAAQAEGGR